MFRYIFPHKLTLLLSGYVQVHVKEDDIDRSHWGELESESESEEESESESEEEGPDDTGLVTPAEGWVTCSWKCHKKDFP